MIQSLLNPTHFLLAMISFPGLSDEQALITALVSQNPSINKRLRDRARSLLLLNDGATPAEVTQDTSTSRRSILDLISRFRSGGLQHALLGLRASHKERVWLTLSPSSAPSVQLARPVIKKKHMIDSRESSSIRREHGHPQSR